MRGRRSSAGRTIERIRVDPPPDCDADQVCHPTMYVYVDPETFYPVEIHNPEFRCVSCVVALPHFEYLPRTPANIALTDISTQRPNATVSEVSSGNIPEHWRMCRSFL